VPGVFRCEKMEIAPASVPGYFVHEARQEIDDYESPAYTGNRSAADSADHRRL
jgi:hypothetical protein